MFCRLQAPDGAGRTLERLRATLEDPRKPRWLEAYLQCCAREIHVYTCICRNICILAKQVCRSCVGCQKVNRKIIFSQSKAGREPGIQPFQSIQVDFTELPRVHRFNSY